MTIVSKPVLLILAVHTLFFFVNHPIPKLSDEIAYTNIALLIANNIPFEANHTFFDRYTVIIPLSLFLKTFGINRFSIHGLNLLFLFTTLPIIKILLKKADSKNWENILFGFAFHPLMFYYIKDIRPDFIFTLTTALLILLLYQSINIGKSKYWILFICSGLFAFLTKESVLIVAIWSFIIIGFNYKSALTKNTIIQSAITTIVCISIYLIIAYVFNTTLFERYQHVQEDIAFKSNELLTGNNSLIKRITSDFVLFFVLNKNTILFSLAFPIALFTLLKHRKSLLFLSSVFYIVSILYLNFGSLSYEHYIPLRLDSRFFFFMLFPISILLFTNIEQPKHKTLFIKFTLLYFVAFTYVSRETPSLLFVNILFTTIAFASYKKTRLYPRILIYYFLLTGIVFNIYRVPETNTEVSAIREQIICNNIDSIHVDERLYNNLSIYFENDIPTSHFRSIQNLKQKGFYWINKKRTLKHNLKSHSAIDTIYTDEDNLLLKSN